MNSSWLILRWIASACLALSTVGFLIGQQQAPTVSRPTASTVQVTPRNQSPSPLGSATNANVGVQRPVGTITGYVYWQINALQPSTSCQGLEMKVITVNQSGMPLQLLSTSNSFTPSGPMTDTAAVGVPQYMLCSYAFQNMPPNIPLRVLLYGPTHSSFDIPPAFQLSGSTCNSTPPSTLQFILTGGESLCGERAFNINFKLTSTLANMPKPTVPMLSGTIKQPGMLSNPASAPNGTSATAASSSNGSGMLLQNQQSSSVATTSQPQTGMLTPAPSSGSTNPAGAIVPAANNPSGANGNAVAGNNNVAASAPGSNPSSSATAGGFTGGVRPGGSNTSSQLSQAPATALVNANASLTPPSSINPIPAMPPLNSNPKRDASPLADAREKTEIQTRLRAQLTPSLRMMSRTIKPAALPAAAVNPDVQALQTQASFVQSFRSGANSSATMPGVAVGQDQVAADMHSAPNPAEISPQPLQVCLAPTVIAVNGKRTGVVFTQDPQFNDYIIVGCGFGKKQGEAYLSGAITGGRINLVVKSWSEKKIEAVVQPGLTGVLDGWPDLIVEPKKASRAKFPNNRFYAQRQTVLLQGIPQQYATLANVTVGDSTHGFGTKYCPGPDISHLFPCIAYNTWAPIDGVTNGQDHRNDPNQTISSAVDRDGGQLDFPSGADTYDLSYMAPGFEIDDFLVLWFTWSSEVCEMWASDAFPKKPGDSVGYGPPEGYYNPYQVSKTKLVVGWAVDHCAWRWLGMFRVDDEYNSGYGLQVSVKGPIGIDPWTGHAIPQPRNFGQMPPPIVRIP